MKTIYTFISIFFFFTSCILSLESVQLIRVVDGDTLKVIYHGQTESVRLIGIDAPESHENSKLDRDAHYNTERKKALLLAGKEATLYAQSLVQEGDFIQLDFDKKKRDKYHRLLAYVYGKNGVFVNEALIQSGHAVLMTIPPNTKFARRFKAIYTRPKIKSRN